MSKGNLPGPESPRDFPQVEPPDPVELHPTNNIRFVMFELAKLIERVDTLSRGVDKLAATIEKGFEKAAADYKERLELIQKPLDDIKDDVKGTKNSIHELDKKVAFVRGATWVLGGLFAIALLLLAAFARKLIG